MDNEYKQYIEQMKNIYLDSHDTLEGFFEWFQAAEQLCDIMCGDEL